MTNPLDEFNQKKQTQPAEPVLGKNMPTEQRKALVKKIVIFDLVVILPVALYFLFTNVLSDDRPTQIVERETSQPQTQRPKAVKPASEIVLRLPSIEQAYKQTNVQRVKFDAFKSKLSPDEKEYFQNIFAITDNLVIERVYNYSAIYYKQPLRDLHTYNQAITDLLALKVPESAEKAHELIVSAVQDQRDYFKFLSDTKGEFNVHNPLVQRSHNNLIQAWQLWLQAYAEEEPQNKLAFEKHLCALDFI